MSCKVKLGFKRKAGGPRSLAFRLFWNGLNSWEGTDLEDTPGNRELANAKALLISAEIKARTFDYLSHFPNGNKAHLFRQEETRPGTIYTAKSYYNRWLKAEKESGRVRPHRIKDYESQFNRHILKAKIDGTVFGNIHLPGLSVDHLKKLQGKLTAKGLKAASVNAVIHGSLRAMLQAARGEGCMTVDLYDRAFFKALPLTDSEDSIDPYTPEERESILDGFRKSRAHYHAFVYSQFWTGMRTSEAAALRWGDIDLRYNTAKVNKSRVQGHEAGTKTVRSNREIHLHENLVEVLKARKPLYVRPEDYAFTTPEGTPVDANNFYSREWLPMLRRESVNVRPRPFYNTRHSYSSFMLTVGARTAFVSKQTGDTIKTIEAHYAKYIPEADLTREMVAEIIAKSEIEVKSRSQAAEAKRNEESQEKAKAPISQGLLKRAGDGDRTHDLMLGKHTL